MQNDQILTKLGKYSLWIKINRRLAGPIFIICIIYILVYLAITFFLLEDVFKLSSNLQGLYFIGFGVFIIAIYLVFTGLLLRGIK